MEKEIGECGDNFGLLSNGRDKRWNEMRSGNLGIQNRHHDNGDRKVGDEGWAVFKGNLRIQKGNHDNGDKKEGGDEWAGFKGLTITSPCK